jgi:hypothetical protein
MGTSGLISREKIQISSACISFQPQANKLGNFFRGGVQPASQNLLRK